MDTELIPKQSNSFLSKLWGSLQYDVLFPFISASFQIKIIYTAVAASGTYLFVLFTGCYAFRFLLTIFSLYSICFPTLFDSSKPVFSIKHKIAAVKFYRLSTSKNPLFLPLKQQKTMKNALFFMVFLFCSLFVCNHGCP